MCRVWGQKRGASSTSHLGQPPFCCTDSCLTSHKYSQVVRISYNATRHTSRQPSRLASSPRACTLWSSGSARDRSPASERTHACSFLHVQGNMFIQLIAKATALRSTKSCACRQHPLSPPERHSLSPGIPLFGLVWPFLTLAFLCHSPGLPSPGPNVPSPGRECAWLSANLQLSGTHRN